MSTASELLHSDEENVEPTTTTAQSDNGAADTSANNPDAGGDDQPAASTSLPAAAIPSTTGYLVSKVQVRLLQQRVERLRTEAGILESEHGRVLVAILQEDSQGLWRRRCGSDDKRWRAAIES